MTTLALGPALLLAGVVGLAGPAAASTSPANGPSPASRQPAWVLPVPAVPGVLVRPFVAPAGPYAAGHRGVDLVAGPGVVRSAGDGRVSFAGLVAGRPVVVVAHAGGLRTTYEPVAPTVAVGAAVAPGAVLGTAVTVGSHCAPRVCLHWGARVGEQYIDPLRLLGAGPPRLLPLGGTGPALAALRSTLSRDGSGTALTAGADPGSATGPAPPGEAVALRSQPSRTREDAHHSARVLGVLAGLVTLGGSAALVRAGGSAGLLRAGGSAAVVRAGAAAALRSSGSGVVGSRSGTTR